MEQYEIDEQVTIQLPIYVPLSTMPFNAAGRCDETLALAVR